MQKTWPGWETVKLIGRGSFGAVYEIQRDIFGDTEKAALKVISIPQNESDIEEMYSDGYDEESITSTFQSHLKNIVAEYSLMRKMNGSANIVNCDDVRYVQHDDGIGWDIFIKMELLTPLTKALPAEVPEETVIKIAKDMCAALELCKRYEIVHRDIKPQNIFVSPNGDYKLGDFGIAKTVEKTMGGTKIGTYKYMAPEVYNNQPYGSAADIYSLGLVLYWLLNKKRMPFLPMPPAKLSAGMDEAARNRRLSGEALPPPAEGSEELKRIVLKACAYRTEDRYASAVEMLRDLKKISKDDIDEPVQTPEPVTPVVEKTTQIEQEIQQDKTIGVFAHFEEKCENASVSQAEEGTIGVFSKQGNQTNSSITATPPISNSTFILTEPQDNSLITQEKTTSSSELHKECSEPEKESTAHSTGIEFQNVMNKINEERKQKRKKKILLGLSIGIVSLLIIAFISMSTSITPNNVQPVSTSLSNTTPSIDNNSEDKTFLHELTYNGHRYTLHADDCSWTSAFLTAQNKGGYLINIDDYQEFDFITAEIEKLGHQDKYFFIGGQRNKGESNYYWIQSDVHGFSDNQNNLPLNHTNAWCSKIWQTGEPSFEYNGNEECYMEMHKDTNDGWCWNDVKNRMLASQPNSIAYIVEYDN